ncbi:neuromedin-S [Gadus morhua]|uniref:neuromedin-S n=1 Tax=Gadus morhua TaxID=8049 RepID=UPI0011B6967D|nr:neuromedin-S [Gadus morhua]XP_056435136.1 neuromedin-S [Gadus chalcogrammus]
MSLLPSFTQLCLLQMFWCNSGWSASTDSFLNPFNQWTDDIDLGQIPRLYRREEVGNLVWRDENEEQVQNVFKRFLFHYSKAHNALGAMQHIQHKSSSVHPLMRLFPKLSQRRKKQLVMMIRELPDRI